VRKRPVRGNAPSGLPHPGGRRRRLPPMAVSRKSVSWAAAYFPGEKRYVERLCDLPIVDTSPVPAPGCDALFEFGGKPYGSPLREFIEKLAWPAAAASLTVHGGTHSRTADAADHRTLRSRSCRAWPCAAKLRTEGRGAHRTRRPRDSLRRAKQAPHRRAGRAARSWAFPGASCLLRFARLSRLSLQSAGDVLACSSTVVPA